MAQSQALRRPGRPKMETPNPIDVRVGARLRLRRNMIGLSQEKLGEALGLTFQQVQKYERGTNRIGASRLYELSRILDVPVSFFFDNTDPARAPGRYCRRRTRPAHPVSGSVRKVGSPRSGWCRAHISELAERSVRALRRAFPG